MWVAAAAAGVVKCDGVGCLVAEPKTSLAMHDRGIAGHAVSSDYRGTCTTTEPRDRRRGWRLGTSGVCKFEYGLA